jgi:hypothetical protein
VDRHLAEDLRHGRLTAERGRYLNKVGEQARAGDAGANAELNVMMVRDWLARGPVADRWPLDYCDQALGGIRKLRRQLEGLGKEER